MGDGEVAHGQQLGLASFDGQGTKARGADRYKSGLCGGRWARSGLGDGTVLRRPFWGFVPRSRAKYAGIISSQFRAFLSARTTCVSSDSRSRPNQKCGIPFLAQELLRSTQH